MARAKTGRWSSVVAGLLAAGAAASASAQTIQQVDFEDMGTHGWWCTGNGEVVNGGGNPGNYLGVPYADWMWITLRNEEPGSPVTGDLTRYNGDLRFSVDVAVFQLYNWFNEPMDPSNFPFVIQFVDANDPTVSVYYVGPGMPQTGAGWAGYTFEVPDPSSTALPPGWGGTGDEDPVTFEPRLPPGRTYRSVMENVGEVRFTTAVPGYFYVSSWWEVGFDNILVERVGGACYANCDGSTTTPVLNVNDFICFQSAFAAGDSYANCDGSTQIPVLNVNDFICFQSQFAAGCK